MSEILSRDEMLLQRDGQGRLLPKRVRIFDGANGESRGVVVRPMTRGEILEIRRIQQQKPQEDTDLLVARGWLVEPRLEPADWDHVRSSFVVAIAQAIIQVSTGLGPQDDPEAELKKR